MTAVQTLTPKPVAAPLRAEVPRLSVTCQWLHLRYREQSEFVEVYGFAGAHATVNLEGLLMRPADPSKFGYVACLHASRCDGSPAAGPAQRAAEAGAHVLCAASHYAKNDCILIMEKVLLDLGAWVRHAREVLGYRHVVLVGWSGGGSLAMFYQSQAEHPSIQASPAGDPVDIVGAGLLPADAVIFQAAHLSRARILSERIDASVLDETNPARRDRSLDLVRPRKRQQTALYVAVP